LPVYADRPDPVNQGDIFNEVPFPVPPPAGGPSMGMVISNDCDVDKFLKPQRPLSHEARDAFRVTMAVVHPVDELAAGRQHHVRQDEMPRYFYLPAEDHLEELCVDLWTEQPVRMVDIERLEPVASLSAEYKNRLWWKIIRLRLGKHYRAILEGDIPPDAA
jgi:hypothetical protein